MEIQCPKLYLQSSPAKRPKEGGVKAPTTTFVAPKGCLSCRLHNSKGVPGKRRMTVVGTFARIHTAERKHKGRDSIHVDKVGAGESLRRCGHPASAKEPRVCKILQRI